MRRVFLIPVAVLAVTIGLRAAAPTPQAPPQTPPAAPPEITSLYRLHCQMCHGARGKAPIPEMSFFEREWKHGTSSAAMAKVITEGVPDTPMVSFKGKLTTAQITGLAKYVRSLDPTLKPEK